MNHSCSPALELLPKSPNPDDSFVMSQHRQAASEPKVLGRVSLVVAACARLNSLFVATTSSSASCTAHCKPWPRRNRSCLSPRPMQHMASGLHFPASTTRATPQMTMISTLRMRLTRSPTFSLSGKHLSFPIPWFVFWCETSRWSKAAQSMLGLQADSSSHDQSPALEQTSIGLCTHPPNTRAHLLNECFIPIAEPIR